jgi:hypothetical protein
LVASGRKKASGSRIAVRANTPRKRRKEGRKQGKRRVKKKKKKKEEEGEKRNEKGGDGGRKRKLQLCRARGETCLSLLLTAGCSSSLVPHAALLHGGTA